MFLSKKEKKYRWEPVICSVTDILNYLKESILIDSHTNGDYGESLIFSYKGKKYNLSLYFDYDKKNKVYRDFVIDINGVEFNSFDDFINNAEIDSIRFADICDNLELWEVGEGNPRNMGFNK